MPMYEYYCAKCREKFEVLRPVREADAPVACERCGRETSARVLSLFAVHGAGAGSSRPAESAGGGGGCCGGACGCGNGHH